MGIDANIDRIVVEGQHAIGERDYLRRDSAIVPVEVSAVALQTDSAALLCVIVRDITARRASEAALRASEARLQAVVRNAPVLLFTLDNAGLITFAAGRGLSTLGLTPEIVIGRSAFHGAIPLPAMPIDGRRALLGETVEARVPIGDFVFAGHYTPLLDESDAIAGVIGVATNITARTRAEAERDRVRRLLAASREEERLRLAWALHDGPVQQLLGVRHHLAAVGRRIAQTSSTAALLPALMDVEAHIVVVARELRRMVGTLRPVGLEERGLSVVLDEYVAQQRREVGEQGPAITLTLDPPTARVPLATERLLLRVAQEGLRNAIRHSVARTIDINLRISTAWAELTVADDGQGITLPPDLSDLASAGHFGLVGLQEEIELARGHFALETQTGAGMLVRARLPLDA